MSTDGILETMWGCNSCDHFNRVKGGDPLVCAGCGAPHTHSEGVHAPEPTSKLVPRSGKTLEDEYRELTEAFLALEESRDRLGQQLAQQTKPRIVVVDERNGSVLATGENIDLPDEGQIAMLRAIEMANVLVTIGHDSIWVKQGAEKGWVTLVTTKSERQMNAEKAATELQHRMGDKPNDDLVKGDHPVEVKFHRIWHDPKPRKDSRTGF